MVVYAIQKLGTLRQDRRVNHEMLLYVIFVITLSGIVNFGLLHVPELYVSISRTLATTCSALLAAGVGFMMSRVILGTRTINIKKDVRNGPH